MDGVTMLAIGASFILLFGTLAIGLAVAAVLGGLRSPESIKQTFAKVAQLGGMLGAFVAICLTQWFLDRIQPGTSLKLPYFMPAAFVGVAISNTGYRYLLKHPRRNH